MDITVNDPTVEKYLSTSWDHTGPLKRLNKLEKCLSAFFVVTLLICLLVSILSHFTAIELQEVLTTCLLYMTLYLVMVLRAVSMCVCVLLACQNSLTLLNSIKCGAQLHVWGTI